MKGMASFAAGPTAPGELRRGGVLQSANQGLHQWLEFFPQAGLLHFELFTPGFAAQDAHPVRFVLSA